MRSKGGEEEGGIFWSVKDTALGRQLLGGERREEAIQGNWEEGAQQTCTRKWKEGDWKAQEISRIPPLLSFLITG